MRRPWRKPNHLIEKTLEKTQTSENCYSFYCWTWQSSRKGQQVSTPQDLGIIGYLWTQNLRRPNYYKTFKLTLIWQTMHAPELANRNFGAEISGGLTRSLRRCNWFFWIQSSYQVAPQAVTWSSNKIIFPRYWWPVKPWRENFYFTNILSMKLCWRKCHWQVSILNKKILEGKSKFHVTSSLSLRNLDPCLHIPADSSHIQN